MTNDIQNIIDERKAVLTLEGTATLLGISTATVRNWVRCGHLRAMNERSVKYFNLSDIENMKLKITNGNISKLNKRANKSKADRTFIPDEYLRDQGDLLTMKMIITFIQQNKIDLSVALLLISLNVLRKENLLFSITIEDIKRRKELPIPHKQIKEEIMAWIVEAMKTGISNEYSFLINCPLPKRGDILGFIYQSLLLEGEKSQNGSYYTPSNIVDTISNEHIKKGSKVLDPCCGTGQFLLAFADIIENPNNIYGIDIDELAVRIARLNLLIKYKDKIFAPNIICKNTLFDVGNYDLFSLNDENIRNFDVIATNPPWGLHFSKQEAEKIKRIYPQILSYESFSCFLKKSLELLKDGGKLSFILPEAILNVKTHKDIRGLILDNSQIIKIIYLDRVFKNVFTPVIRMDLEKCKKYNEAKICKAGHIYKINQDKWRKNQDFVFEIHLDEFDAKIIEKIYAVPHTTLKNQADWALGIVTGNNSSFISNVPKSGFEEVYKGKDVERFILKPPSNYIQYLPDKFQQVAPEDKYRAKEKLIYKFISKYLVFAFDDKQKLTLNSANVVIPKIADYPIKVIAALFNSSLYQFIFQKKYSSIKVLRSHIEGLPLPLWGKTTFNTISDIVDKIIDGKTESSQLDNYILSKYPFSEKELSRIKEVNG